MTFDAASLERRYSFLDSCPEHLLPLVATLPFGHLQERVTGLLNWREALLAGRLPVSKGWPTDEVQKPVCKAIEEMGLLRFCKEQPELVDELLKDIFSSFQYQTALLRSEVATKLKELERLERIQIEDIEKRLAQKEKRSVRSVQLDAETQQRLQAQAERVVAEQERAADGHLIANWKERARVWAALSDVFGDLSQMMGRGWDMVQGVLRHTGWLDIVKLQKFLEKLPQIREIVQALGRLQLAQNEMSVADKVFIPVQRLEEERLEIRTPLIPAETRGIERSGEISRMLPVEALLLGHPKLRLLWHARRVERALLTYRVEGIEIERRTVEREVQEEQERQRPRPERGPILAVMDTSGSMHGLPEKVAKALVLEAVRTAHREKRKCFLYAYSGPGQVLEYELNLAPEGITNLLSFLSQSFGGGNDEAGVMAKVVARLKENQWKKADIVFVSDGEWPAPHHLITSVMEAKEGGTRFHGVQIGNRGRTGLHAICDPVHIFQDWAKAGGW